ncbi:MAG: tetratricopeptide repeat protein [Desulfonatronovibrio sp.]
MSAGRITEAVNYYDLFLESEQDPEKRYQAWERLLLIHLDINRDVERGVSILRTMSMEFEKEPEKIWSIYTRIGILYSSLKRHESAIDILERAVHVAPDDKKQTRSYINLSQAHQAQSNFIKAIEALNQARKMESYSLPEKQAEIDYLLGRIHYQEGSLEKAIQYLEKSYRIKENMNYRAKAGILLYDIYLEMENWKIAEQILIELEEFYPNPAVIRMRMQQE